MPPQFHGPAFETGTLVRMKYLGKRDPSDLISRFGCVIISNADGFMAVGVDWFEWDGGHNMAGRLPKNSGWFVNARLLEATTYQRIEAAKAENPEKEPEPALVPCAVGPTEPS